LIVFKEVTAIFATLKTTIEGTVENGLFGMISSHEVTIFYATLKTSGGTSGNSNVSALTTELHWLSPVTGFEPATSLFEVEVTITYATLKTLYLLVKPTSTYNKAAASQGLHPILQIPPQDQ
jgi:hypothetical protein